MCRAPARAPVTRSPLSQKMLYRALRSTFVAVVSSAHFSSELVKNTVFRWSFGKVVCVQCQLWMWIYYQQCKCIIVNCELELCNVNCVVCKFPTLCCEF